MNLYRFARNALTSHHSAAAAVGSVLLMLGVALPTAAQDLYVDASNTCPGTGTQADPYCSVQDAVDAAAAGNVIDVAAGTYAEAVNIPQVLTLQGPNAGRAGSDDARGAEAVLAPPTGGAPPPQVLRIAASNVVIDGIRLDAQDTIPTAISISSSIESTIGDVIVRNSVFENVPSGTPGDGTYPFDLPFGAGIAGVGPSTGNTFANNLFQAFGAYQGRTETAPERTSIGVLVADGFEAAITDNRIDNVAFGVLMTQGSLVGGSEPAPEPVIGAKTAAVQPANSGIAHVSGGNITNVRRGIVFYPGQQDATYAVDGVSISGAAEFGIVSFRFSGSDVNQPALGDGSNDITATIRDVTISGTGNVSGDAAAIATNAFSGTGSLTTTIENCTIRDNQNRGINARGADDSAVSVSVTGCVVEGNGYDPNSIANAHGIIAQRGAEIVVTNTIVNNASASQSASNATAISARAEGQGLGGALNGRVTISDSQILAPVGTAAGVGNGSGGVLNASGNWWGTSDAASIAANISINSSTSDAADYSPFLNNGTDTDSGTAGFQGDFSVLNLDSGSDDAQSTGTKLEEVLALGGSTEIILQSTGGAYDASAPVETFGQVTVADNLTFTGDGPLTIVNNELVVADGVTAITGSPNFNVQNRFTGSDGAGNDADWRILSAPRVGMTGADIGQTLPQASAGSILYTWNGTQQDFERLDLNSGAALTAGEGFFLYLFDIAGRDQIDADPGNACGSGQACIQTEAPLTLGDPVSDAFGTASVEVAIAGEDNPTTTEAGYVLGNPFAQSFNPSNLTLNSSGSSLGAAGEFVASVQAWNPATGQFEVINTNPASRNLAPWQGFWVLRTPDSSLNPETLTFASSGRTTGAPFIPARSMTAAPRTGQALLTLQVEDEHGASVAQSQVSLYAHENATLGRDVHDAPRIAPPRSTYAQVSFVRNGDRGREAQHSVPYDLREYVEIPLHAEAVGISGDATISTHSWTNMPADWTLTLEDTETGARVPMMPGETYRFELEGRVSERAGLAGGVQHGAVSNPRFVVRVGPEAPLPVELTTFAGQAAGQAAVLSWTTASETNNAGFNVQRQSESGTYETVAFVEGAGTTSTPQSYRVRVEGLSYGPHTFRLRQVDVDGTATPSEPIDVAIQLDKDMALTAIAPNPVHGQGTAEVTVRETQNVTATLYDALGRRIRTLFDGEIPGQRAHPLSVDASTLASGTYFIRVQGKTSTRTTRLVVVR